MQYMQHAPTDRMSGHASAETLPNTLLTTSMDWTAKLWNFKLSSQPLYSFDNASDYVFDTCWSPRHPALFCTADGDGHLDLWNINRDVEAGSMVRGEGRSVQLSQLGCPILAVQVL